MKAHIFILMTARPARQLQDRFCKVIRFVVCNSESRRQVFPIQERRQFMVWLLRLEFFKLRHNPQLLALIAAIFILGVFAAGSKFSNLPQEYEEPGSDIPLYAAEQDFFQPAYSDETSYLRYVNSVYQTSFLTLDAFYDYINGEFITDIVFPDIMGNSMITYAAAFLLPFFYLLRDFKNRALNGSITSGFPRRSILRTRVIFYFVLIMFVELLITLTALTFYGKSWSSLLPASHIILVSS
jgi:hypothetical protein